VTEVFLVQRTTAENPGRCNYFDYCKIADSQSKLRDPMSTGIVGAVGICELVAFGGWRIMMMDLSIAL
jgi:hypothetical protein